MATTPPPNKRAKTKPSWSYWTAPEPDTGERWTVIWDTKQEAGTGGRNTAVEKSEHAAVERARSFLSMGFFVYELRAPSGSVLLDEAGIKQHIAMSLAAK